MRDATVTDQTLLGHKFCFQLFPGDFFGYTVRFSAIQARRSFRSLRGLARLQGVVRGHNVNRQTVNAMKTMQLLVRVQSQIQSRRIQMLENQVLQCQAYNNGKELESTLSKWTMNQVVNSLWFIYALFHTYFW